MCRLLCGGGRGGGVGLLGRGECYLLGVMFRGVAKGGDVGGDQPVGDVPVRICANKAFACPSVSTTSFENMSFTTGMALLRPAFVNQGISPGHNP